MTDYTDSFEATWKIYPKRNGQKRGKIPAFKEWEKLDLEEQRLAYADIKARNMSGGWEFVRDMERYLKHQAWEDEWTGKKVTDNPDLIDAANTISLEDFTEYALEHRSLCFHQIQQPWNYYGSEPGAFEGVVINACYECHKPQTRIEAREIPV